MTINSEKLKDWMNYLRGLNDVCGKPHEAVLESPPIVPGTVQFTRYAIPSGQLFFAFKLSGYHEIMPSGWPATHADIRVRDPHQVQIQIRATPPGTELFPWPITLAQIIPNICDDREPIVFGVPWRIQEEAVLVCEWRSSIFHQGQTRCAVMLQGVLVDGNHLRDVVAGE
jgi:hypothetical protein